MRRFSKFVLFAVLLLAFAGGSVEYSTAASKGSFFDTLQYHSGGTIVTEGNMLIVTSDDPTRLIQKITIFDSNGSKVMKVNGCFEQECSVSLSELITGTYLVIVHLPRGISFQDYIEI